MTVGDIKPTEYCNQIHIILVEPIDSRNIGAVARAMMNFGFRNLHLVQPGKYMPKGAKVMACWAKHIVDSAKIHNSLEEALKPMTQVVGFSSIHGKNRIEHLVLPQWCESLSLSSSSQVALVFGPEDTGLRNEHVPYCNTLVRIPSSAENPSFNLAQSVLLVLFELSKDSWGTIEVQQKDEATAGEYSQADKLIFEIIEKTGFTRADTSPIAPDLLRNIVKRVHLEKREMAILLGFLNRIVKSL